MLLSVMVCKSQTDEPKTTFAFIIEYRSWEYTDIDSAASEKWVNRVQGFYSFAEMLAWLKKPDIFWYSRINIAITED